MQEGTNEQKTSVRAAFVSELRSSGAMHCDGDILVRRHVELCYERCCLKAQQAVTCLSEQSGVLQESADRYYDAQKSQHI